MKLEELEKVKLAIRLSEGAAYDDAADRTKASERGLARVRELIQEFEDSACQHAWKRLIKTSKLNECDKCKARRFDP